MKKIITMLMAMGLMAGGLGVATLPASAAESKSETVLTVSALTKGGKLEKIDTYTVFEDGWNDAMDLADDPSTMKLKAYDRIVVDLHKDWEAVDGQFTEDFWNGPGFDWDAIYIQDGVKITLNLNGHTIDRGLTGKEDNGEVMCVDEKADIIINNGTITGGFSSNGAGAIHVEEGAKVTLNNVHIFENGATDADGAGISLAKDAVLTMNGGSFKNNKVDVVNGSVYSVQGGAVYVDNATAVFNDVTFDKNWAGHKQISGVGIYAKNSEVEINNCTFTNNGLDTMDKKFVNPSSVVCGSDSTFVITDSEFKGNEAARLIYMSDCEVLWEGGSVINNTAELFYFDETNADIKVATITNNNGKTMRINNDNEVITLVECVLGSNTTSNNEKDVEIASEDTLIILDCKLNDTTFSDDDYVKVTYSGVAKDDAAISVATLAMDGTTSATYYRFFEYGWNLAIEYATTNDYERVIVDLYGDWIAEDGQFTDEFNNGAGFNWDALYFPAGVKITLNMNGHTIDRGLDDNELNGEVMYIDKNADVIINDGTISGGNSHNGAGGIHVNDKATVTLNNVHIKDNRVEDDDGSAIALYNGATLTMNGGSISNNELCHSQFCYTQSSGTIYVNKAEAILTDVEISGNGTKGPMPAIGVAICMSDSSVTMKNCKVVGNGYEGGEKEFRVASSIIRVYGDSSVLDITDTNFENNSSGNSSQGSSLICVSDGIVRVKSSTFTNNASIGLFYCYGGLLEVADSTFTKNNAVIFTGSIHNGSYFTGCTFDENTVVGKNYHFKFEENSRISFTNCEFGNSTFNDVTRARFDKMPEGSQHGASIFGKGSFTMIISLTALIASAVAIFLFVTYYKKKEAPATANNEAETKDKE